MSTRRRAKRNLAFATIAIAVVANGCDLLGPGTSDVLTLVRVNGQAVPYTISRSLKYGDPSETLEVRWSEGRIVMFLGGRLDWEIYADRLINHMPREAFPPHRDHVVDRYTLDGASLRFRGFEGTFLDGGRRLSMKDRAGLYDFDTFEFERR